MVQLFIQGFGDLLLLSVEVVSSASSYSICQEVSREYGLHPDSFYLQSFETLQCFDSSSNNAIQPLPEGSTLQVKLRICGGIDFQHREGGKTGSGGQLGEAQAALERKERLRKLALETIDITKDPYFMRNHLGTFECKLCLTLHPNEVS
jgi:splicing factor 3A subunit 2